jgi:hypothetical protein
MSTKTKTVKTVTVETPVGTRTIREDQRWWEGNGRGHVREFIPTEDTKVCARDGEEHPVTAFPTFTVPRQDGRTRGDNCRDCTAEIRAENKVKARRRAAAAKARAAKAAKREAAKKASKAA